MVPSLAPSGLSQTAPLTTLPIEVLVNIARNLTTPEYGELRLTCKQIEDSLLEAFSKEFFTKRQFFVWTFSLQTLVDISKSRFATSLRHIIIGVEQPFPILHSHTLTYAATLAYNPSLGQSPNRDAAIVQEYADQMTLLNGSHEVEFLAEAFSNLPKLETVAMRDFNPYSRHRDAPDTAWKSILTLLHLWCYVR